MSLLSWLLKPKREMAKPNTKRIRLGKYKISSHAQNRVAQKDRQLKKTDLTNNLFFKPDYMSKIDTQHNSYTRVRKKIVTYIVPKTNVVKSIRKTHDTEKEIKNLKKRGL